MAKWELSDCEAGVPDETAALVERLCAAIGSITGWMDPDFAEDAEALKVADAALAAARAWQAKNGGKA